MPLSQAFSRAVEAVVIEADMPRYRAAFERLLDILQGIGPDVEAGDLGVAYVRLDGLARLYGGLDGTLEATARVFPPSVTPPLGVGQGKRLAYLASQIAEPGTPVVLPRVAADVLAPHPVGLLPVSWAMKQRLLRFRLATLGQVAALPLSAVQAQFGPDGRLEWELANGIDRSTFAPRQPEVVVRESLAFPDPVTGAGPLLLALEAAVHRRAPWAKRDYGSFPTFFGTQVLSPALRTNLIQQYLLR